MVIHSQRLRASASEVHAMVEGAIRHGTTMTVEGNYVDAHGQSEIGFGITRLLGFDLLPRIKAINHVKLYRPAPGEPEAYPRLGPALTRPIRWDLIAQQYDQMIKYATAIPTGTASTEAILRRFTRSASHPTYQARLEVGRAQRTLFVARYLRDRQLQREITEGLNVVEAFNRANAVIYYGKGAEIASNRADEQEMSVACLRILQAALVWSTSTPCCCKTSWPKTSGPASSPSTTAAACHPCSGNTYSPTAKSNSTCTLASTSVVMAHQSGRKGIGCWARWGDQRFSSVPLPQSTVTPI
ncbi:MAG: transposase [Intrasporangium sp.]|nr:transposase [Intrasporangium sp.]